jgi:hypothetical protein
LWASLSFFFKYKFEILNTLSNPTQIWESDFTIRSTDMIET